MNPVTSTTDRLQSLLADLPPDSLTVVEQFVQFLHEQAQRGQPVTLAAAAGHPPYRYPTVALPAASLDALVGVAPAMGGDALADTEALYDGA